MTKFSIGTVTIDDLGRLAALQSRGVTRDPWDAAIEPPDDAARVLLQYLTGKLAGTTRLNEATVWSRAVYPLLELAEVGGVRAWAAVPIMAKDPHSDTEIAGIVDGVLAPEALAAGDPGHPFLLVVEAKRGVHATDPWPQLLAALLAVLWTKLSGAHASANAEAFGCFTVSDTWTFVHAAASTRPEGREPRLAITLSWSPEYAERVEGEAIFRVLRWIARQGLAPAALSEPRAGVEAP